MHLCVALICIVFLSFFPSLIADLGEARGCNANTVVINLFG